MFIKNDLKPAYYNALKMALVAALTKIYNGQPTFIENKKIVIPVTNTQNKLNQFFK